MVVINYLNFYFQSFSLFQKKKNYDLSNISKKNIYIFFGLMIVETEFIYLLLIDDNPKQK